ncbi:MAG: hypothetical protein ACI9MC_003345 [Kiritimatiellia bacterium]|jgi:hypothetical protein
MGTYLVNPAGAGVKLAKFDVVNVTSRVLAARPASASQAGWNVDCDDCVAPKSCASMRLGVYPMAVSVYPGVGWLLPYL